MGAFGTVWDPECRILRTTLTGTVGADEVGLWRDDLHAAVAALPEGTRFKLLTDLRGYEPVDLAAHRALRNVIPLLLAAHGMRPAVVELFADRAAAEAWLLAGSG